MNGDPSPSQTLISELPSHSSFLRAIVEGMPGGFLLVDRDYTIRDLNPTLLGWIQQRREDVLGKKCHQVLFQSSLPCQLQDGACPATLAFSSGKPSPKIPCSRQSEKGSRKELEIQTYPILDDSGAPLYALEFIQDVTAKVLLKQYQEEAALRDPLTGLYNRKAFHLFFERGLKRTQRQGHPFSLALVDIDSFKDYNEKKGDTAGDALLEALGMFLLSCTRKEVDTVFRLEADRFSILLPETDYDQTCMIGERIRTAEKKTPMPVAFSLVICQADEKEDTSTLLHRAEEELYKAKKSDGTRIV